MWIFKYLQHFNSCGPEGPDKNVNVRILKCIISAIIKIQNTNTRANTRSLVASPIGLAIMLQTDEMTHVQFYKPCLPYIYTLFQSYTPSLFPNQFPKSFLRIDIGSFNRIRIYIRKRVWTMKIHYFSKIIKLDHFFCMSTFIVRNTYSFFHFCLVLDAPHMMSVNFWMFLKISNLRYYGICLFRDDVTV